MLYNADDPAIKKILVGSDVDVTVPVAKPPKNAKFSEYVPVVIRPSNPNVPNKSPEDTPVGDDIVPLVFRKLIAAELMLSELL